jgi:hypothetical protein
MITLTKAQVKYVDDNLKEKTIIRIAKELSDEKKLEGKDRIRRRDLIEYFKEKFNRDIFKEKFSR